MIIPATRRPESARAEHGNLFDELNPHLRNAKATSAKTEEIAYQYLVRRGPQPAAKIAQRLGNESLHQVVRLLQSYPGLFVCDRGVWSASPAHDATRTEPEAQPAPTERAPERQPAPHSECMTARAINFLRSNGPATSEAIGIAVGTNASTIAALLCRRHDVVVVETRQFFGRRTANVWGLRDGM